MKTKTVRDFVSALQGILAAGALACSALAYGQQNNAAVTATLTGLSISGPSTVVWGESAAYTATATYSDGGAQAVKPKWLAGCDGTVDAASGVLTAAQQKTSGYPGAVFLAAVFSAGGISKTATMQVSVHASYGLEYAVAVSCPFSAILLSGWNLLGNSTSVNFTNGASEPLAIPANAEKVWSVWKWVPSRRTWAFYSPFLSDGGAEYAASKDYEFLTTIYPGEGFWVNAKAAHIATLGAVDRVVSYPDQPEIPWLFDGWNLISLGRSNAQSWSPSEFNRALSVTPPASGEVPLNFETLWTWNADLANWHFYAPSLEAQGGTALSDYIAAKGYLGFGSTLLEPGTGFWVNKASTGSIPFSTISFSGYSGVTTAQNVVVRDASTWVALWATHTSTVTPQPQLPSIDFNTEMILGVFLGARSSSCYRVEIQKVNQLPGRITVEYKETTPPGLAVCAMVISYPFHLVAVPLSSDPVDFVRTVR